MLSSIALNSLDELVSPCLTPLLILIFSLSLCRCTVTELSVYMSFRISMYYGSFLVPLCDFFLFVLPTLKLEKSTLMSTKSTLKLVKSTLMSVK